MSYSELADSPTCRGCHKELVSAECVACGPACLDTVQRCPDNNGDICTACCSGCRQYAAEQAVADKIAQLLADGFDDAIVASLVASLEGSR